MRELGRPVTLEDTPNCYPMGVRMGLFKPLKYDADDDDNTETDNTADDGADDGAICDADQRRDSDARTTDAEERGDEPAD